MTARLPSAQAWSAVPFHHVLPPCQVPLPSEGAPVVVGSQNRLIAAAWAVAIGSTRQVRPRANPSSRRQRNRLDGFSTWDNTGVDVRIGLIFIVSSARKANPPATVAGRGDDRKSTRLNSSHLGISYAVFCLKKK